MKRSILFPVLLLLCAVVLSGCSASNTSESSSAKAEAPAAVEITPDIDLTVLSSTFVYSEVYNMVTVPEDYLGKIVRMNGVFAVAEGEERNYYACIIADATSCCSQGIEFVLADARTYPSEYPELGTEIVVQGAFDIYEEYGVTYCQLIDAQLLSK